jgi:ribonuclease E
MSQFGIVEMTRQRMRPSIKRSIYQDCPHCRGSGLVKTSESMMLDLMRVLRLAIHNDQVETVELRVAPSVAFQLQNRKRASIHALEQETNCKVVIRADDNFGLDQYVFECLDRRGGTVKVIEPPEQGKLQPPRSKRQLPSASEARPEGRDSFEDTVD